MKIIIWLVAILIAILIFRKLSFWWRGVVLALFGIGLCASLDWPNWIGLPIGFGLNFGLFWLFEYLDLDYKTLGIEWKRCPKCHSRDLNVHEETKYDGNQYVYHKEYICTKCGHHFDA